MWPDNETAKDFLNFSGVAGTAAEIVVQAQGRPISIGVSGAWGVGKSSMIKLIRRELEQRTGDNQPQFVFVEFNAWLYQGYDDARAALMEVIAEKLQEEAEQRKSGVDHVQEFLRRVNWLRATKLTVGAAASLALGLPPIGGLGEIISLGKKLIGGTASPEDLTLLGQRAADLEQSSTSFLKPKGDSSPPKEIEAMRKSFEDALEEMKIRLVVLIDDLDRCLPETTISTLEAIRLFLFLKNTAFVIAADDAMIKHAVRRHFEGVDDALVISYFDKLIQIPIRVPPLGTQEVRAYLMLLFVEDSTLENDIKETIRKKVCEQLANTWRGMRVDRAFVQTLHTNFPPELDARLETAERLAPILTRATQIAGNPRLIKRFLNALYIRMSMSRSNGVGVDEKALAKMLLFERCGEPKAYAELIRVVNEDVDGKPRFLKGWEDKVLAGEQLALKDPWDSPFFREWLAVPPCLADTDLRGITYVSREQLPVLTPEDRLSSEGAELLSSVLQHPEMAEALKARLAERPKPELALIMDRLLDRARQEQTWGVPPILNACLAVVDAEPGQGLRLAAFLRDRPPTQITPAIVPLIADRSWASDLLDHWKESVVSNTVKRAITQRKNRGNV